MILIDKNVFKLIKTLSNKYQIYSIVNEAPKWTDIRVKLFQLDKYIKKIIVSSEVGLAKPDKRIFELFLKETKLKPEECLFVDDRKENIKSARLLGFKTELYADYNNLLKRLKLIF